MKPTPDDSNVDHAQRKGQPQPVRGNGQQAQAQHPEKILSRSITDHMPVLLTFQNVSKRTLELLLGDKLPEIAPIIANCLLQTILDGSTIPANPLLESYLDTTRYSISQTRLFRLGPAGAIEESHRICIECDSEIEPRLFELSLNTKSPRSVDFTVCYSWMDQSKRWDDVIKLGSLIGVENIGTLFSGAPPELCEQDSLSSGITLLTGDISIYTESLCSATRPPSTSTISNGVPDRWSPREAKISAPLYNEQAAFLSAISPDCTRILVQSGLFRTLDVFGGRNLDLNTRLLDRAARALTQEIQIEVTRELLLGADELTTTGRSTEDLPYDRFGYELCEGTGWSSSEDEALAHDSAGISQENAEEIPFSSFQLYGLPVSSRVSVSLDVRCLSGSSLVPIRVEYFSTGQQSGTLSNDESDPFNFAVPAIGVRFLNGSPMPRELAYRWRVLGAIAGIGGVMFNRREAEEYLDRREKPKVRTSIGFRRLLMGFEPPRDPHSKRLMTNWE
jgi:hypothetical protein